MTARPFPAFIALLCLTARAFCHGDLHEQITAVTAQLKKEPGNAALYHQRGELHRAHADHIAALADYDRAAQLDPRLEVVHLSRGRTLLEAGRPEPAGRELTLFLARQPAHAEARLLRARARGRLGQHREADDDFARAIAATADPIPDLFLERAANLAATGDHKAALAIQTAAIRRLGPLAVLEDAALETELALHRTDAALARLDARLATAPRKELLLERKARVLLAAGRAGDARATFRSALDAIAALPPAQQRLRATTRLAAAIDDQLSQIEPASAR
jgi:predicted Zn-dependent protease